MASTLDQDAIAAGRRRNPVKGHDTKSLGPSDSSDSGADVQGERTMPTDGDAPDELGATPAHRDSASDALGTGERGAATGADVREGADILPDRVIDRPDEEVQAEVDALSAEVDESKDDEEPAAD